MRRHDDATKRLLGLGVLALLGLACGSRSALLDPFAGGGSAGTGALGGAGGIGGGGGAATGGGGSGAIGGGSGCFGLQLLEPVAEIERMSGWRDGPPELASSSDDGQQLTVAFVRQPSAGGARELRHASFAPWLGWPPPLPIAPVHSTFASTELSEAFALGASSDGQIALLVAHSAGPGSFASFAPSVSANASAVGPNVTLQATEADLPVFVARGPEGHHLVATSDGKMLTGHVVQFAASGFAVNSSPLACGANAAIADAVPWEGGWLVALANEKTAPPPPSCSAAANGPTRLDVAFVGADGSVSHVLGIEEQTPIVRIAAAPHPAGAHLVWRVASGGVVAPIRWARVDVPAAAVIGPADVSGSLDLPLDDFAATSLGSGVAVVWGNDPAGNPPDLTVSVLDELGGVTAIHAMEPPFFGPLAIASAPGGQSLVVGWHEQGPAPNEATVEVARLDCVP